MFDFDNYEQAILSIEENTEILLTVNGKSDTYKPVLNSDESWDLDMIYSDNKSYGLSCQSLKELRYLLLADYATGIITNAYI